MRRTTNPIEYLVEGICNHPFGDKLYNDILAREGTVVERFLANDLQYILENVWVIVPPFSDIRLDIKLDDRGDRVDADMIRGLITELLRTELSRDLNECNGEDDVARHNDCKYKPFCVVELYIYPGTEIHETHY